MSDHSLKLVKRFYESSGMFPSDVARHLGMSIRTAQRWQGGTGVPLRPHLQKLAALIADQDAELASDIYDYIDDFHRSQGLQLPSRPDRNAVRNGPDARMADEALGAAAAVLGVSHEALRPALRAALVTARNRGATLDALILGLDRGESGWEEVKEGKPADAARTRAHPATSCERPVSRRTRPDASTISS